MLVCAAGDCHGKISLMYENILAFERQLGRAIDLVVQVGDFGFWPEESRLDKATKERGGGGDFPLWWAQKRPVPRPTIAIPGNHEDFVFLSGLGKGELLPGLKLLLWGESTSFEVGGERLRIGGVGGCFGDSSYHRSKLSGGRRRHYMKSELEKLLDLSVPLDILLFHDAPAGSCVELFPKTSKPFGVTSQSEGLAQLIGTLRPRCCFTGHLHFRTERRLRGVKVVGCAIVPTPGSLVAFEFGAGGEEPVWVGEWERSKEEWLGIQVVDEEVELWLQAGEEGVELMIERLGGWAQQVMGGARPGRVLRQKLYELLEGNEYRSLLMGALNGLELSLILRKAGILDRISEVNAQWDAGLLPAPEELRSWVIELQQPGG